MVWCGQKHQKKVTTCTMSCKISAKVYKWPIKAAQMRRPNSDMNNKTFQHHHESFWWSLWGHWTSRWIFALIFPSQMFFGDPHWKAPDQRQIGTPVCDNRYVWSVQRRDPKVCQPARYPNIRWSQRVGEPGKSSSQWDQTLLCFPPPVLCCHPSQYLPGLILIIMHLLTSRQSCSLTKKWVKIKLQKVELYTTKHADKSVYF